MPRDDAERAYSHGFSTMTCIQMSDEALLKFQILHTQMVCRARAFSFCSGSMSWKNTRRNSDVALHSWSWCRVFKKWVAWMESQSTPFALENMSGADPPEGCSMLTIPYFFPGELLHKPRKSSGVVGSETWPNRKRILPKIQESMLGLVWTKVNLAWHQVPEWMPNFGLVYIYTYI